MTRYTPLWEQQGNYAASVDRRLISTIWPAARTSGLAVTVVGGMTVQIAPGSAAVPTANSTGSVLCVSDAVENLLLAAAPASGLDRYDLVIVRPRGNDLDGGTNNDFIFDFVEGPAVTSGTATPPAAPAGTVELAYIGRPGGEAAIVAGDINDSRPGDIVPGAHTGDLKPSAAAGAAPSGWLVCDGSAVRRWSYPALFAALGGASSPWGQGDGSTTFNLPDMRGRVPMGTGLGNAQGATNKPLGQVGGNETQLITNAMMPPHSHGGHSGNDEQNHTHYANSNSFFVQGVNSGTAYSGAAPGTGANWAVG
ncbi:MAG TPA: tail fiber protein, partial [Gaiellaceae bacterium]|nr:tail fiber protein [Gaiellaceae bacterium]